MKDVVNDAAKEVVSFYRMEDGTREDYDLLEKAERDFKVLLPQRILAQLRQLEEGYSGYHVSRLEHSLQSDTRALRDGRDDDYVAMCLVHDLGDLLAPWSHGDLAAAVLKPFVREELVWIAKYHPIFQYKYSGVHIGADPDARDRFAGSPHFDACAEFCELYDQGCFDPTYRCEPLVFFEPLLQRIFEKAPPRSNPIRGA